MKLRVTFLLLALVFVGSLSLSCAPSNTTSSSERVVEFWVMPNSLSPVADIETLLVPFEKKTGIRVKITSVDWGAAWSKITTAATSGGHALPTGTPHPGPPARTVDRGFR